MQAPICSAHAFSKAGCRSDRRADLVDFINNDVSIEPDGHSQKYRGETTKENSAYIIRLADVYLIRAPRRWMSLDGGIDDLNTVPGSAGLDALSSEDFETEGDFLNSVLDEREC
ncbi:MAG: hypothetical protein U0U33_14900 [Chitinophagaceae bacterium]